MASQAAVLHPPSKQQIARAIAAGLPGELSQGLAAATGRAVGVVNGSVRLQAYTLSFIDGFHLTVWARVGGLILVALLHKSPLNYGELGFPDGQTAAKERTKS